MPRFKLTIEYDGTPYVGFQRQANGPSVQGTIEAALAKLGAGPITVRAAGRTDTGVHATGQVIHIDLDRDWPASKVMDALNFHLKPAPVAALAVEIAAPDFDSRFSAKARHYLYRIVDRRAPLGVELNRAWHVPTRLDAEAMDRAAKILVGHHDFTTFRSTHCQSKSPLKTLDRLDVARVSEDLIEIRASARSFLHNQVRSMVGSVKLVGEGKWDEARLAAALAAADRTACGAVAPSAGLYLVKVDY
jgi:tRNA pseudouridine38-40 synthase